MSTGIPYVDESCNPVIGCTKCSPACQNCWAIGTVAGLWRKLKLQRYEGVVSEFGWTGSVRLDYSAFGKCRRKKPTTYLLSSLGDWLHESLREGEIQTLLQLMKGFQQHRFYTLTKRPERWEELGPIPPNVWLGASVWDQESYDRTKDIAACNYSKVWFSLEPLLGPIQLRSFYNGHWIVVGAESGKNRRPCKIEWIDSIVRQCKERNIPCFVKQIDYVGKLWKDPLDFPMRVTVREIPK